MEAVQSPAAEEQTTTSFSDEGEGCRTASAIPESAWRTFTMASSGSIKHGMVRRLPEAEARAGKWQYERSRFNPESADDPTFGPARGKLTCTRLSFCSDLTNGCTSRFTLSPQIKGFDREPSGFQSRNGYQFRSSNPTERARGTDAGTRRAAQPASPEVGREMEGEARGFRPGRRRSKAGETLR